MKTLWITNILLPEAAQLLLGKKASIGSGGWLASSAIGLVNSGKVSLSVISVSPRVKDMTVLQGESIKYYILPQCKNKEAYEPFMLQVKEMAKPDLVHIHGTEWPYGLAYINACGSDNVVVSMQGLLGVIAHCYTDGLTRWEIIKNITPRDLRLKTILGEKAYYEQRASLEREVLRKVKHVIGRTSFDHDFVMQMNPSLTYHFCNESLRAEFYGKSWAYEKCTPHTIFLSQANYPIKGLHQMMKALPIIKDRVPDVKVRIAGSDITKHGSLSEIAKYSGYGKIIYSLIRKYNLQDVVSFTGLLNAEEMVGELLQCNLYVCPSSCENSSNSIAEAQILGVPCLASKRGGNPDMIPHAKYGTLFDFDDIQELADMVVAMFETSKTFDNAAVRDFAAKRHDKETNLAATLKIYEEIIGKK